MMVYVEGRIQSRQYEDKEGNKKNITEIRAENFQMLERRDNAAGQGPQIVEPGAPSEVPGGDMPF
jgi:single-strand DNA-binding protein